LIGNILYSVSLNSLADPIYALQTFQIMLKTKYHSLKFHLHLLKLNSAKSNIHMDYNYLHFLSNFDFIFISIFKRLVDFILFFMVLFNLLGTQRFVNRFREHRLVSVE
jgi:hypothetical protein